MTTARRSLEFAAATAFVLFYLPIVVLLAAPARVVRCVYRDGRGLWRMLAP